jgi:hypothetical protein
MTDVRRTPRVAVFAIGLALALGAPSPAGAQSSSGAPATSATPTAPTAAPAPTNPHAGGSPGMSPHGGAPGMNPHGGGAPMGGSASSGIFTPPQDGADVDPSVPIGTLIATIVDASNEPIPDAEVLVLATHASIAQGDTHERFTQKTDANGTVTFRGLQFGTSSSYVIRSSRGGADYEVGPVSLSDQAGVRAMLHVYDATNNLDDVRVLSQASVVLSIKEDVIVVEQRVDIANLDPVSWLANVELALPATYKAFTTPDDMQPTMVASGTAARLRGTVPPGGAQVVYRYHIPLENSATQSFDLNLLPRTASVRVVAEASKKMGLKIDGFPEPTRQRDKNGKGFLITQKRVQRGDNGFLTKMHVELTGLPTRGWGAWLAVGLAVTALVAALGYALSRSRSSEAAEDTLEDLVEAKEALVADIVELERLYKRGEVGPRTYGRVRQAMLDALARIMTKIERAGGAAGAAAKGTHA